MGESAIICAKVCISVFPRRKKELNMAITPNTIPKLNLSKGKSHKCTICHTQILSNVWVTFYSLKILSKNFSISPSFTHLNFRYLTEAFALIYWSNFSKLQLYNNRWGWILFLILKKVSVYSHVLCSFKYWYLDFVLKYLWRLCQQDIIFTYSIIFI